MKSKDLDTIAAILAAIDGGPEEVRSRVNAIIAGQECRSESICEVRDVLDRERLARERTTKEEAEAAFEAYWTLHEAFLSVQTKYEKASKKHLAGRMDDKTFLSFREEKDRLLAANDRAEARYLELAEAIPGYLESLENAE